MRQGGERRAAAQFLLKNRRVVAKPMPPLAPMRSKTQVVVSLSSCCAAYAVLRTCDEHMNVVKTEIHRAFWL